MKEYKQFDIVEILWQDTITINEIMSVERIKNQKRILTKSTGYFIHETNDFFVVAFMEYGDKLFKYFQIIPRVLIKDVRKVNDGKSK